MSKTLIDAALYNTRPPFKLPKDPYAYIAFWQLLAFIVLLLLIWYNELSDFTAVVFNLKSGANSFYRGCVLTAGVFLTAVIVVGNTYLQEKRVLNALISVCANCHRVRINRNEWKRMEDYISDNSLLTFTHGLCPMCHEEMLLQINAKSKLKE